ncbi:hypothetical protein GCM10022291_30520 [Postechiella marina]|uniref:DUF2383 domain-containing protein n=1 Tax=Postechiella marina TaxID=943941 RepID=A0ABP8CGE6_9FLAO
MKAKQRLPYPTELQQKLNRLFKELNNAVKRFYLLAQIAKTEPLVLFYHKKLEERKAFRSELKAYLKANDVRIETSGTVTGAFSRLHTKIKTMFDNDEDEVSLTKAKYHDESLLYDYKSVLSKPEILSDNLKLLLENHYAQIASDVQKMNSL